MKTTFAVLAVLGSLAAVAPFVGFAPMTGYFSDKVGAQAKVSPLEKPIGLVHANLEPGDPAEQPSFPGLLISSTPFFHNGDALETERAADCLAAAAWYEAGDDTAGQRAVIQTVINRVKHPAFPDSVCGVVFEGSQRTTGCQFTFTCDGSLQSRRPSASARLRAVKLSKEALGGLVDESIGEATHYHANYVVPWWSGKLERLTTVGPHIFYKWRGSGGGLRDRVRLDAEADFASLVSTSGSDTISSTDTPDAERSDGLVETARVAAGSPAALPRPQNKDTFFVVAQSSQPSGRWAIDAMQTCKGRAECQVVAYGTGAAAEHNKMIAANERARPLFLFVKDRASGMELALWDCQSVQRKRQSQCLPADANALTKLMRDR